MFARPIFVIDTRQFPGSIVAGWISDFFGRGVA